eukprot:1159810-Pelagomonas_calceolata.AAC.14
MGKRCGTSCAVVQRDVVMEYAEEDRWSQEGCRRVLVAWWQGQDFGSKVAGALAAGCRWPPGVGVGAAALDPVVPPAAFALHQNAQGAPTHSSCLFPPAAAHRSRLDLGHDSYYLLLSAAEGVPPPHLAVVHHEQVRSLAPALLEAGSEACTCLPGHFLHAPESLAAAAAAAAAVCPAAHQGCNLNTLKCWTGGCKLLALSALALVAWQTAAVASPAAVAS